MEQKEKNNTVLNLDEALGTKILKVRYQGKEYQIRTVKSLSPEEFGRVMAYGEKFSELSDTDMSTDGGLTVIKAIDDVLSIIGPDLPKYKPTFRERFNYKYRRRYALSLQECTAILQFWSENNRQKN